MSGSLLGFWFIVATFSLGFVACYTAVFFFFRCSLVRSLRMHAGMWRETCRWLACAFSFVVEILHRTASERDRILIWEEYRWLVRNTRATNFTAVMQYTCEILKLTKLHIDERDQSTNLLSSTRVYIPAQQLISLSAYNIASARLYLYTLSIARALHLAAASLAPSDQALALPLSLI